MQERRLTTSILVTLLPMPMSLLQNPATWTTLINGNVWITVGLFVIRCALNASPSCLVDNRMSYMLGIGRSWQTLDTTSGAGLAEIEKKRS
jgi:hypothetical protein